MWLLFLAMAILVAIIAVKNVGKDIIRIQVCNALLYMFAGLTIVSLIDYLLYIFAGISLGGIVYYTHGLIVGFCGSYVAMVLERRSAN